MPLDAPEPDTAASEAGPRRIRDHAPGPFNVGRRRIVGDIGVQVVARAGNLVLGVVVTLIVVRALGVRGFGQWSTILAIAQITASFGDLGLTQVAVSRAASDPDAEPAWLGALLGLRLILSAPICVIQIILVLAIAPNAHVAVAGVLIALTAVVGAASSLTAAFQLRVRNDLSMLVMTVNSVLWTGGAAAVAAGTSDIRAFALVFLAVNVTSSSLTVVLALRTSRIHMAHARRLWNDMLRVGVVLGAAGILVTFYVRLDQVLVFQFAGSRQAGFYGAAYRILDQVQFIPMSLMTTLFPLIASAYSMDLGRTRRLLQSCAEYLSIGSFGALAFTAVAARRVMVLLFGARFAPAAPALPVLMGAFVSISFGYLAGNMVVILGLQRRFLAYAGVGLLVNVVLNVALIPQYGFQAAAWVTLVTEVVVTSLSLRSVLRALEMRLRATKLIRITLTAAAMGGAVWLVGSSGATLGEMVLVAAFVYPVLLVASGALAAGELKLLLRRDAGASTGGSK